MAKYWDVGQVKTRLGSSIGMLRAAQLHRLFVLHLCQSLSLVADCRVVCLAPDARHEPFLSELSRHGLRQNWETMRQAEGSLGNRMLSWFDAVFRDPQRPASHAILIGADCPLLSAAQIEEADHQLESFDVVIGPATDGGYYLIGLSAPWTAARFRTIFENVPWSTNQVLRITLERMVASDKSAADNDVDATKRWIDLGAAIERVLTDHAESVDGESVDAECLEP